MRGVRSAEEKCGFFLLDLRTADADIQKITTTVRREPLRLLRRSKNRRRPRRLAAEVLRPVDRDKWLRHKILKESTTQIWRENRL